MFDQEIYFPRDLSPELRELAFQVEDMVWPAWDLEHGLRVVEEMRSLSIAVMGGNLVLKTASGDTQAHYTTAHGEYVLTFDVERESGEAWRDFVHRSCDEASDVLQNFTPCYPVSDPMPYTLGFLLIWQTEQQQTNSEEREKPL